MMTLKNSVNLPKVPPTHDAIRSPWQGSILGKQKQFVILRNHLDRSVIVRILSKNVSNPVSNFFRGQFNKQADAPVVEAERRYANISKQDFENEKREIQKLIDKHASAESLLEQVEKDFKTRAESINAAAENAFSEISEFAKSLDESVLPTQQSPELDNEIAGLRKNLAVEKESLEQEICAFSAQVQSLPPDMRKDWNELVAKKQEGFASDALSLEQLRKYRSEIKTAIAKVRHEYQTRLCSKIGTAISELQDTLDAANDIDEDKLGAHNAFAKLVLELRKNAWRSLEAAIQNDFENDLSALLQMQQLAVREQSLDLELIAILEIPLKESFLGKIQSSLTAWISPFKEILPSFLVPEDSRLLNEKEHLDREAFFRVDQTLKAMSAITVQLLELLPEKESDTLAGQQTKLFTGNQLNKSDLNAFVDHLISFAQTEKDTTNAQEIQELAENLQAQKDLLGILLQSHQQHVHVLNKNIKGEYPQAFSPDTHASILAASQEILEDILPEAADNPDLRTLADVWQNDRKAVSEKMEAIKHLEVLEKIQKEYSEIREKRASDSSKLTGEEKTKAETALVGLSEAILSLNKMLEENVIDLDLVIAYKTGLLKANSLFDPLFHTENKKRELRTSIKNEIKTFNNHLDLHVNALSEIEEFYSISLADSHEMIVKKRENIKARKEQGRLPAAYLNYLPKAALPSILYYGADNIEFQESQVIDLSLNELDLYLENLKTEIIIQQNELSSTRILESYDSLKTFLKISNTLDSHIQNLTGAVKSKKNSQTEEDQIPIPKGLSSSSVERLQFYNAKLTQDRQNKLLEEQQKAISAKPHVKLIHAQLKNDIEFVENNLKMSKEASSLSLLEQIAKLEKNPPLQNLAKKAFVETLTTKMAEHTKAMTGYAKSFKNHAKIHNETLRYLEQIKLQFSSKLSNASRTLQLHAEGWNLTRESHTPEFSTKENLSIATLSIAELKSYNELIDQTIKTSSDYIKLISNTYSKIESASRKLEEKLFEAKKTCAILDQNNQLITSKGLERIIKQAEKSQSEFFSDSEEASEGMFKSFTSLMTPSKNVKPSHTAYRLLEDYKKNASETIAKIDAALKKAKQGKTLTIPQQLALNPDSKTAAELRERFQNEVDPLIESTREKLESYKKHGDLSVAYIRYVASSSRLFQQIERAIDDKLHLLDQFEHGYRSKGITSLFTNSRTPTAEMSPREMEEYSRQLTRLQTLLEDDLNKKFQIDNLVEAQLIYEKMLNETVKKHTDLLRKNGLYKDAYLFERKIEKITEQELYWVEKVTQPAELRELIIELKKLAREMRFAIDEVSPKRKPDSYEDQISILLAHKAEYSKSHLFNMLGYDAKTREILAQIDLDIHDLKAKVIAKIDHGHVSHTDELKKLRGTIEEIYATYNITIQPKEKILSLINGEIDQFENERGAFDSVQYPLIGFLNNSGKPIEDMEPEEIAEKKPEKKHQTLIKSSLKKISSSFNYKLIEDAHGQYNLFLDLAERTHESLVKKGQISHAYTLNAEIEQHKKTHRIWKKKNINNPVILNELAKTLTDLSTKIKFAAITASKLPEIEITDQVAELGKLDPSSPYQDSLRNAIQKNILDTLEEQKNSVKKSVKNLRSLVRDLGCPSQWRDTIANELEAILDRTEQQCAGKKVKTVSWNGWYASTSELSLSQLPLKDLVEIRKAVKTGETELKQVVTKYSLKSLNDQLDKYNEMTNGIHGQILDWKSEHRPDCANKLEYVLNKTDFKIKQFFKDHLQNDLKEDMKNLLTLLRDENSRLYYKKDKITREKPLSWGLRLKGLQPGTSEYNTLHTALGKRLQQKLETHQKEINTYFKKIDQINQQIMMKIPGCRTLSNTWRRAAEAKTTEKLLQIEDLAKGLPIMDSGHIAWKPYEDLTIEEIIDYESMVERLTTTDKNTPGTPSKTEKTKSTTVLARIEKLLKLNQIEKYLGFFQRAVKELEFGLAKPSISNEKKEKLEAIIAANKKLVFSAFKNHECLGDTISLLQTLEQAQAALFRAAQEKDFVIANLDPWSAIRKHEDSKAKGDIEGTPFKNIIEDGFVISYRSYDPELRGDQVCDVRSFMKNIDEFIEKAQEYKMSYEISLQKFDISKVENNPRFKQLVEFTTNRIPQILAELMAVKAGVAVKDKQGLPTILKPQDIKTFDQLLTYKNTIDKIMGKFNDELENLHDSNILYWNEQVNDTTPADKPNPNILALNDAVDNIPDAFFDEQNVIPTFPSNQRTANRQDALLPTFERDDPNGKQPIAEKLPKPSTAAAKPPKNAPAPIRPPITAPPVTLSSITVDEQNLIGDFNQKILRVENFITKMCQATHQQIGKLKLNDLNDLITNNPEYANYKDEYSIFKSLLTGLVEGLINHQRLLKKEYPEKIQKILPFKDNESFKKNLMEAFGNIVGIPSNSDWIADFSADKIVGQLTINQLITPLKNLSKINETKINLENIAQYSRQIYDLVHAADPFVLSKSEGSAYLSGALLGKCRTALDDLTIIYHNTDLKILESNLKKLVGQLEKGILYHNQYLVPALTKISQAEKKFKDRAAVIKTTLHMDLKHLEDPVLGKYAQLREFKPVSIASQPMAIFDYYDKLFSPNTEKQLHVYLNGIDSKLEGIRDNSFSREGKIAAKKFEVLGRKFRSQITEYFKKGPYESAKKLEMDFENAKIQLSKTRNGLEGFVKTLEKEISNLEKSLDDAKEDTQHLIKEFFIPEKHEYGSVTAKAIVDIIKKDARDILQLCHSPTTQIGKNQTINKKLQIVLLDRIDAIVRQMDAVGRYEMLDNGMLTITQSAFNAYVKETRKLISASQDTIQLISNKLIPVMDKMNLYTDKFFTELLGRLENQKPKPYYNLAKLAIIKDQLPKTMNRFMEACGKSSSADSLDLFLQSAETCYNDLHSFEITLNHISHADPMDFFEQLDAAEKEIKDPLLYENTIKILRNGLIRYGLDKINEILIHVPVHLDPTQTDCLELAKLKSQEPKNSSEFKNWITQIRAHCREAQKIIGQKLTSQDNARK